MSRHVGIYLGNNGCFLSLLQDQVSRGGVGRHPSVASELSVMTPVGRIETGDSLLEKAGLSTLLFELDPTLALVPTNDIGGVEVTAGNASRELRRACKLATLSSVCEREAADQALRHCLERYLETWVARLEEERGCSIQPCDTVTVACSGSVSVGQIQAVRWATSKVFGRSCNLAYSRGCYSGWALLSPHVFSVIARGGLRVKARGMQWAIRVGEKVAEVLPAKADRDIEVVELRCSDRMQRADKELASLDCLGSALLGRWLHLSSSECLREAFTPKLAVATGWGQAPAALLQVASEQDGSATPLAFVGSATIQSTSHLRLLLSAAIPGHACPLIVASAGLPDHEVKQRCAKGIGILATYDALLGTGNLKLFSRDGELRDLSWALPGVERSESRADFSEGDEVPSPDQLRAAFAEVPKTKASSLKWGAETAIYLPRQPVSVSDSAGRVLIQVLCCTSGRAEVAMQLQPPVSVPRLLSDAVKSSWLRCYTFEAQLGVDVRDVSWKLVELEPPPNTPSVNTTVCGKATRSIASDGLKCNLRWGSSAEIILYPLPLAHATGKVHQAAGPVALPTGLSATGHLGRLHRGVLRLRNQSTSRLRIRLHASVGLRLKVSDVELEAGEEKEIQVERRFTLRQDRVWEYSDLIIQCYAEQLPSSGALRPLERWTVSCTSDFPNGGRVSLLPLSEPQTWKLASWYPTGEWAIPWAAVGELPSNLTVKPAGRSVTTPGDVPLSALARIADDQGRSSLGSRSAHVVLLGQPPQLLEWFGGTLNKIRGVLQLEHSDGLDGMKVETPFVAQLSGAVIAQRQLTANMEPNEIAQCFLDIAATEKVGIKNPAIVWYAADPAAIVPLLRKGGNPDPAAIDLKAVRSLPQSVMQDHSLQKWHELVQLWLPEPTGWETGEISGSLRLLDEARRVWDEIEVVLRVAPSGFAGSVIAKRAGRSISLEIALVNKNPFRRVRILEFKVTHRAFHMPILGKATAKLHGSTIVDELPPGGSVTLRASMSASRWWQRPFAVPLTRRVSIRVEIQYCDMEDPRIRREWIQDFDVAVQA